MWVIILRTAILYTLLIVSVRLMGKREIGQMEPSEFVVSMMLANLATIPMEEPDKPLLNGVIPIALIFGAELLIAYLSLRSIKFRKLLCGKPVILIENGKILDRNLRSTRINLDELTMALREKGLFDLSEVKFAILETNGQISTLSYAETLPATAKAAGIRVRDTELPVTLISDGRLLRENLELSGRTEAWLEGQLRLRHCSRRDVLLLTVDKTGKIYFVRRENS